MQPNAAAQPPKQSSTMVKVAIAAAVLVIGGPCVIGILAAVAIPAFVNYVRRSKTSEATANVRAIARLEEIYCQEHSNFLFPAGPVPGTATTNKQVGDFASDPTFHQLGFDPAEPVYYSYAVLPQGAGEIVVTAHGDLDGDGAESTFAIRCLSSCTCEAAPTETDPTE